MRLFGLDISIPQSAFHTPHWIRGDLEIAVISNFWYIRVDFRVDAGKTEKIHRVAVSSFLSAFNTLSRRKKRESVQEIQYLIRGLIIGLSISVPVGPIGVLCIRRTLTQGRLAGLLSGLGAATADALYGAIAGFGLTFLVDFIIGKQIWLRLIGGGLLCILGAKIFLSKPAEKGPPAEGNIHWNAYLSAFFLTLTNPMTILFFTAVFAGLGVGSADNHYLVAGILVLGVFIGSASWWLVLSNFTGILRGFLNIKRLQWLNKISGLIIMGFGLFVLLSLL